MTTHGVSLFVAAVCVFCLTGCGGDGDESGGSRNGLLTGKQANPAEDSSDRGPEDLTGRWTGNCVEKDRHYNYEFQLKQSGQKVTGTSHIEVLGQPEYFADMEVSGELKNGKYYFRDVKIVAQNRAPMRNWKLKSLVFKVQDLGSATKLTLINPKKSTLQLSLLRGKVDSEIAMTEIPNQSRYFLVFCAQSVSWDAPVGHAFVVWIKEDELRKQTVVESYGFYPDPAEKKKVLFSTVKGDLRWEGLDALNKSTHRLKVEVDEQKFLNSKAAIERFKTADYALYHQNCITLLMYVANAVLLKKIPKRHRTTLPATWLAELIEQNSPSTKTKSHRKKVRQ